MLRSRANPPPSLPWLSMEETTRHLSNIKASERVHWVLEECRPRQDTVRARQTCIHRHHRMCHSRHLGVQRRRSVRHRTQRRHSTIAIVGRLPQRTLPHHLPSTSRLRAILPQALAIHPLRPRSHRRPRVTAHNHRRSARLRRDTHQQARRSARRHPVVRVYSLSYDHYSILPVLQILQVRL